MKYMKICSLLAVLLLLGAGSAEAQECFAQAQGANMVRAEGLTEVVGNVRLLCRRPLVDTGADPFSTGSIPASFKVALVLNTRITNTITDGRAVQLATPTTATVTDNTYTDGGITLTGQQLVASTGDSPRGIIDSSATPTAIAASRFGNGGKLSDDGTMIEWTFARQDDPDTTTVVEGVNLGPITDTTSSQNGQGFLLTISGIRANAYMVGNGEDVVANVTVGGVAVNATPLKLSDVNTGLDVKIATKASGLQCSKITSKATITLAEGFNSAFMAMPNIADDDTTSAVNEALMSYSDTFVVTFTDVPEGVKVMVPNEVPLKMNDPATTNVNEADLSLALMRVTGRTSGADSDGMVELSASGAGQVMYKIVTMDAVAASDGPDGINGTEDDIEAADPASTVDNTKKESVDLDVTFSWDKGAADLGEAWVFVSYYPLSSHGGDTFRDRGAAVPRFMEDDSGDGIVEIDDCMTTLFYPFVTSASGYDTGIVVSNTSGEAGDCSADYSGSEEAMDLGEVMAGGQSVFLVSSHMMDFSGYLEVSCDTESASGFAHVVDTSGFSGSQGYIAQCTGGCK